MKRHCTITHKGWFGLCPVWFADLDGAAPVIEPRHWVFEPVMTLSEACFAIAFELRIWCDPFYEPEWPLRVTGEVEPFDLIV